MEISDALVALAGAVIGGGITGYYTLKATDKALREQDARERLREEKEIENLLDALGVEMKTLWEFHMRRIGNLIEELPDGKPLEFYYPLTQDYFTIYNSNAALIGRIKDRALSEAIVVCYNKCKKVVDGFKYNNDLLRDAKTSGDYRELADYARIIKEDHFELKGYVERLLGLLGQYSINNG
ncbi:MAG: hypothetical protein KGJ06_04665 [Pseudomonadota bacterium]|nr:hypothetical protein [Pseudomonadota bacterium]